QPGQRPAQVCISIVDSKGVAPPYLDCLLPATKRERKRAARSRAEIADDQMGLFQIGGMLRLAVLLQIGGRRTTDEIELANTARHQRLLRNLTRAKHAVDVIRYQIDGSVRDAKIELNLRIAYVEARQCGN